jgi:hypothetical protein
MFLEAVDDLAYFRLLRHFAQEDFRVFQGRRVNRHEAVGTINLPSLFQKMLARNHQLRRIIPKSFQRPRLDEVGHKLTTNHTNNTNQANKQLSSFLFVLFV